MSDEIKVKSKFRQFFCRHHWVKATMRNRFLNLQGKRIYTICDKCGCVLYSVLEREE